MSAIKLNDVLKLDDLENVKIRFNIRFGSEENPVDPMEVFKEGNIEKLLEGHYWVNKSFKDGQVTIGFIRIKGNKNLWLLFHVGKITKDLDKLNGVGYEYEVLDNYEKYFGRLIIKFENKSQNMIRDANTVIDDCEVAQILSDKFDDDVFPGYDKVNISWQELSRVIEKDNWKTALKNQKGVYLITDISNGKMYVGSAYGENMILGRWQSYIKTGNGGNVELKKMEPDYMKSNFKFSILDIYKSTIDDQTIIDRENWWKDVLQTNKYGYNKN